MTIVEAYEHSNRKHFVGAHKTLLNALQRVVETAAYDSYPAYEMAYYIFSTAWSKLPEPDIAVQTKLWVTNL